MQTLPASQFPLLLAGTYRVRLASDRRDLESAQRLRFEVFNLELGEGLSASHAIGRDEDAFDASCDHLLVEREDTGEIVGTYRLQTGQSAGELAMLGKVVGGAARLLDLHAGIGPHAQSPLVGDEEERRVAAVMARRLIGPRPALRGGDGGHEPGFEKAARTSWLPSPSMSAAKTE